MRNHVTLIVCSIFALGLLIGPSTALADDSDTIKTFTGAYQSTLSKAQARKQIDKSIESLVGDMAFYKRPFARTKLENRTPPCINLEIRFGDGDVSVGCDDRRPAKAALDGARRGFTPTDGDPVEVSYALKSGVLVQKFFSENGVRTNKYRVQNGGATLKLDVEIQSTKLPRPLRYERTFESR